MNSSTASSVMQIRKPLRRVIAVVVIIVWTVMGVDANAQVAGGIDGFIYARDDVTVSTNELGEIIDVQAVVGQTVRRGDLLMMLDDRVQTADAALSRAQASFVGNLDMAKAELANRRTRLERLQTLAQRGAARPSEVINAETEVATAMAQWVAAKEQMTLRKLQAERDGLAVRRRQIRSPIDGVIVEVHKRVGESASPGDNALMRILVVDVVLSKFSIPYRESTALRVGDRQTVFIHGARRTVEGTIERIAPIIDGSSGTVEVRIAIDNADGDIRVGDTAIWRATTPSPSIDRGGGLTTRASDAGGDKAIARSQSPLSSPSLAPSRSFRQRKPAALYRAPARWSLDEYER